MAVKHFALVILALEVVGLAVAQPASDEERKLVNKLMAEQVMLTINNVSDPDHFVEDNDPNTLQIVYFTIPGKSHVSDDGEVVFIPESESTNIGLINVLANEAFHKKAKRILGGQK